MMYLINFLIESSICLLVFYAYYQLFQKKETCFHYNRVYLIISSLFSLIIPWLNIPLSAPSETLSILMVEPVVYLPEVVVNQSAPTQNQTMSWVTILPLIYLGGILIFAIRLVWQFWHIMRIIKQNKTSVNSGPYIQVIPTHGKTATFSFFQYLFWDNTNQLKEAEQHRILAHEKVHIQEKHSLDILYFEILAILFWFNPIIHLYKKAIQDVHEYIADYKVLRQDDKQQYIETLVKQSLQQMNLSVVNHFNKSQIMKRINMMEALGKKIFWPKLLFIIPLAVLMFVAFSCQEEEVLPFNLSGQISAPAGWNILPGQDINNQMDMVLSKFKQAQPESNFYVLQPQVSVPFIDAVNQFIAVQEQWKIAYINHPQNMVVAEFSASGQFESRNELMANQQELPVDEVFTIVEDQPEPIGGMQGFYKYITNELSYPLEMQQQGIEGKVFIQFIVNKQGQLTEAKVIKGIHPMLDQEALRVIKNSPQWIPGKQRGEAVNVRMIIPITFKVS